MLTRIYDSYLEIVISLTCGDVYKQVFDSSWKLKDSLAWMYNTFAIDESRISTQICSYVKRYKLKNDGNN